MALLVTLALTVRLVWVLGWRNPVPLTGDAGCYQLVSRSIADGDGYVSCRALLHLQLQQSAEHAPGFVSILAFASFLGLRSPLAHLLLNSVLGWGLDVIVALLGRRLGGQRAGLVAAGMVAVSPGFWLWDGSLMSETLTMLTTAIVLYLAYIARSSLRSRSAIALGAAIGVASLTRAEAALTLALLAGPLFLLARGSWRRRVSLLVACWTTAAVVLAPWVGYNLSRFEHPVLLTTQFDSTLMAANCDSTYSGPGLGYWDFYCAPELPGVDEVAAAPYYRRMALSYIRGHLNQLPKVLLAREGRTWGVFRPWQSLSFDQIGDTPVEAPLAKVGLIGCYMSLPLAVLGGFVARRRRLTLIPPLAVLGQVAITSLLVHGDIRFRVAADVVIVVFAAIGVHWLWEMPARRTAGRAAYPSESEMTGARRNNLAGSRAVITAPRRLPAAGVTSAGHDAPRRQSSRR
ncbi:MAG: ArnT family glycosyltransferase [Frankiaceae bacterium]